MLQQGHYDKVGSHYDRLAQHGPFATLAPHNKGGRKGEYVAAVFDAAILPTLRAEAPYGRILDFGCGTGIFTCQAASLAREVIGTDVSTGMLDVARALCKGLDNVVLLHTDGSSLPIADGSVHRAIARESLCYVPEGALHEVLSEIRRVLVPGGSLLWLEQVSTDPRWQHNPGAPSLVKRSPADIRAAAARAGLIVESERKVRSPRFPWIYPIWLGLLPRRAIPMLARYEVSWHAHRRSAGRRWWNALFVMRNPDAEH